MHSVDLKSGPREAEESPKAEAKPWFLEDSQKLGQHLSALAQSHIQLAALETRQAGEGLVNIMMIGFFTACLLFSAWISLLGAVVIVVIEGNIFSNVNTFLLLALFHCVIVLALIKVIRYRSHLLMFSATVNSLAPANTRTNP